MEIVQERLTREYDLDLIPHSCGYKLIAFYPVVIKVALSNIDNFIKDHKLKWIGIKDALYHDQNIYLSYTKENKDNCYSIAILKSQISDNLNFEEFYSFEECVGKKKENDFSRSTPPAGQHQQNG